MRKEQKGLERGCFGRKCEERCRHFRPKTPVPLTSHGYGRLPFRRFREAARLELFVLRHQKYVKPTMKSQDCFHKKAGETGLSIKNLRRIRNARSLRNLREVQPHKKSQHEHPPRGGHPCWRKVRFWQKRQSSIRQTPVISCGCSSPMMWRMEGATSASTPFFTFAALFSVT